MSKNDKQQRKLAREAVLQALYAKHVSDEEPKKVLHDIFIIKINNLILIQEID